MLLLTYNSTLPYFLAQAGGSSGGASSLIINIIFLASYLFGAYCFGSSRYFMVKIGFKDIFIPKII
jgi:hypothetical protein